MTAWKQVPIQECGEALVPVGPFSDYPQILSSAIYAGERVDSPYAPNGLPGAILTPFVRTGVAERLAAVAADLPPDHYLLVWDSYRSIDTQAALYDYFDGKLREANPKWSDDEIATEAQRFVSVPSTDPTKPSPHNTGGVVDLTIVRLDGDAAAAMRFALAEVGRGARIGDWRLIYEQTMQVMHLTRTASAPLPMGTRFDEVVPATIANYFEDQIMLTDAELQMAGNRTLLRYLMQEHGFHPYGDEWWHFSHGDQMWGLANGCPAVYGAAEMSRENEWFEHDVRRAHQTRQRIWHDGHELAGVWNSAADASPVWFARSIARNVSDPRASVHPPAHEL